MACRRGDPLTKRSKTGLFLDNSGGAAHFKEGQRYGLWVSLVRHAPLKLIICEHRIKEMSIKIVEFREITLHIVSIQHSPVVCMHREGCQSMRNTRIRFLEFKQTRI